MFLILADNIDGGLYAAAALFGELVATALALCAVVPARQRKGWQTLAMTAPAMIVTLLVTIYIGYGYVTFGRDPDFSLSDFAGLWLIGAGPPLATSLLAIVAFWLSSLGNTDANRADEVVHF